MGAYGKTVSDFSFIAQLNAQSPTRNSHKKSTAAKIRHMFHEPLFSVAYCWEFYELFWGKGRGMTQWIICIPKVFIFVLNVILIVMLS